MPPMPFTVKVVLVVLIVLLVGAIVLYHVWLDRRFAARTAEALPPPDPVTTIAKPVELTPAAARTSGAPAAISRRRRAPTRRTP